MQTPSILIAVLVLTTGFLTGCQGRSFEAHRLAGARQAEEDYRNGTAEVRMMCGTIAPGPCSSVEDELAGRAWAQAYNARLEELRR